MADVFVSYASEDRARVRPLAEALQAKGFSVWWDRSLAAGQDYTAIIERELRAAKAVIVIWTQSSTLSTFVRDEAGRARDQGRLVPLTFDAVDIPLGFGAFQAEDFSRWNGGADAPQMQILVETLRAKIEGRDVDGAEIARKRRRLMTRVRLVSVLSVIALIIAIAVGGRLLVAPQQEPDLRAELLRLLAEGQLTPEQAIQLAQILETGALGEAESAALEAPSPGAAPDPSTRTDDGVELASISEAEFDASAREVFRDAFNEVARHPDASVRLAAAQLTQDNARDAAMQSLWNYAGANPDDPLREQIYLLCASVGEANGNELGVRALEMATAFQGRDSNVWRMLSRAYDRLDRNNEAVAAADVSESVESAEAGNPDAERRLQDAAQALTVPEVRAEVTSELGRIAEARGDYASASARFSQAYSLRERSWREGGGTPVEAVQADAQMLVRSLDRAGRTREACERLRQAQETVDVAAPDQDLLDRCQRQYRVPLRERVGLAPRLRESEPAPTTPEQQRSAPY